MNIKTTLLASVLLAGLPIAAQAQNAESYDNYQVGCQTGAECGSFNVNYQQPEANDEVAQRTRTRRVRRTSSRKKIYIGGTLGLFFPGEFEELEVVSDGERESVDPGTGFGGSLYAGYNFSEMIGADLELVVFGAGAEPLDDSGLAAVGFFINPRFTLAFSKDNPKSPYAYVSPGLGIVGLGFDDEIDDQYTGDDLSGSGLGLQLKAGVGYPLSESFSLFGQARYLGSFNNIEIIQADGDEEDIGLGSLGLEAGINFSI